MLERALFYLFLALAISAPVRAETRATEPEAFQQQLTAKLDAFEKAVEARFDIFALTQDFTKRYAAIRDSKTYKTCVRPMFWQKKTKVAGACARLDQEMQRANQALRDAQQKSSQQVRLMADELDSWSSTWSEKRLQVLARRVIWAATSPVWDTEQRFLSAWGLAEDEFLSACRSGATERARTACVVQLYSGEYARKIKGRVRSWSTGEFLSSWEGFKSSVAAARAAVADLKLQRSCGLEGDFWTRIADCGVTRRTYNWAGGESFWSLLLRDESGYELWYDERWGLIWADSSLRKMNLEDATQFCSDSPADLDIPSLPGFQFRLPTHDETWGAHQRQFERVLPHMKEGFWTSSPAKEDYIGIATTRRSVYDYSAGWDEGRVSSALPDSPNYAARCVAEFQE